MAGHNPEMLREIKKVYFLVHPYWGFYGHGQLGEKGGKYYYEQIPDKRLYADMLEWEWHKKEMPKIMKSKEVEEKNRELNTRIKEGWTELHARLNLLDFLNEHILTKAKAQEVEKYREITERLYKGAINEATRRKDSLFIIVSNPSIHLTAKPDKHSRQVVQRTHEYKLLKYAREKLGTKAIIIQEEFKPVSVFRLITGRGFRLAKNVEIEAFGETAKIINGKACVPHLLGDFIKSIPNMQKYVENKTIHLQREAPPPEVAFSMETGKAILIHKNGKREEVKDVTVPKGVKVSYRRPLRIIKNKPLYWINLSRSGIPLKGIKPLAAKLRR